LKFSHQEPFFNYEYHSLICCYTFQWFCYFNE